MLETADTAEFFTRWSQGLGGPFPLRVHDTSGDRRIEVYRDPESAAPEIFTTAHSFMETLHGEQFTRRHWTLDRYLQRGRYAPDRGTFGPAITLVGPMVAVERGIVVARGTAVTVLRRPPGIDLDRRGIEVAKLLRAGFQCWITSSGYDFDDVLQEVYRKILVANRGKSPWTPAKSSFGHYVHMVCRSALSNLHRRESRVRSREQLGLPGVGSDGLWASVDVSGVARGSVVGGSSNDPVRDLQAYIQKGSHRRDPAASLAVRLVPFVQEGHTLKDAAGYLQVGRPELSRALKLLRRCAAAWAR